jgi:hypothetical protein
MEPKPYDKVLARLRAYTSLRPVKERNILDQYIKYMFSVYSSRQDLLLHSLEECMNTIDKGNMEVEWIVAVMFYRAYQSGLEINLVNKPTGLPTLPQFPVKRLKELSIEIMETQTGPLFKHHLTHLIGSPLGSEL